MNEILQLEPTWQQRIAENIERGVSHNKIISTLSERGLYSAAYELMSQQSDVINIPYNIPYIDMTHNSIDKWLRTNSYLG